MHMTVSDITRLARFLYCFFLVARERGEKSWRFLQNTPISADVKYSAMIERALTCTLMTRRLVHNSRQSQG